MKLYRLNCNLVILIISILSIFNLVNIVQSILFSNKEKSNSNSNSQKILLSLMQKSISLG